MNKVMEKIRQEIRKLREELSKYKSWEDDYDRIIDEIKIRTTELRRLRRIADDLNRE